MKTLIAIVSIGDRSHLSRMSLPRIIQYAAHHRYNVAFITNPIQPEGRQPHFAKLCVHKLLPGFDRYCVIDDDILLDPRAPPLPDVPPGHIGLARDHVQENTQNPLVEWTGNTGFIVFDQAAFPILDQACQHGDEESVWGYADQGALNYVLWTHRKAFEIDGRWNFAPVLSYFVDDPGIGWTKWNNSKFTRIFYFANLLLNPTFVSRRRIRENWGIHLIRAQYNWLFDRLVAR